MAKLPPVEIDEEDTDLSTRFTGNSSFHRSDRQKIRESSNPPLRILWTLIKLLAKLFAHFVLTVSLRFEIGWSIKGRTGWYALSFVSFLLVLLIEYVKRRFCWQCRHVDTKAATEQLMNAYVDEDDQSVKETELSAKKMWTHLGGKFLFWFVYTTFLFALLIPSESITPTLFAKDLLSPSTTTKCSQDPKEQFDKARLFYELAVPRTTITPESGGGDQFNDEVLIDYTDVKLVHGGMPTFVNYGLAMVIDNTIHVNFECLSVNIMVHEMFHLWQMQSGWFFDGGIIKLLKVSARAKQVNGCRPSH